MLRSRSEGGLGSVGNKVGMLRSRSEGGLGSDVKREAPQLVRTESLNMRSYAVIKALPNESKFMHVELSANDGILYISMLQEQDRVRESLLATQGQLPARVNCARPPRPRCGGKVLWCVPM